MKNLVQATFLSFLDYGDFVFVYSAYGTLHLLDSVYHKTTMVPILLYTLGFSRLAVTKSTWTTSFVYFCKQGHAG